MPDGSICRTGPSCKRHGNTLRELAGKMNAGRQQPAPKVMQKVETPDDLRQSGRPFDEVITLGENEFFCINQRVNQDTYRRWQYWYRKDGKNLAMLEIHNVDFSDGSDEWVVCDIEVREDERGKGLGLAAIRKIEALPALKGKKLHTSGGYTPEGFNALGKHLPLSRGDGNPYRPVKVEYESMAFVDDWDTYRSRF